MTEYKVVAEKEYTKLDKTKPTIGLVMMVKNEKKRLQVTLDSVVGFVDALIIYDTGSTDNTMDIVQNFSAKHKINLYLIQGDFVNFCASRNVSLEYADKIDVHYLLYLDCNDELRGGEHLRDFAKFFMDKPNDGFLSCQQWFSGQDDKYYNIRFVKNRAGWRYKGSVHEWLYDTKSKDGNPTHLVIRMPDNIILYQDRTQDDDKTSKRFTRDKILLLKDVEANPQSPRSFFYLAQTCQCLNQHEEAMYYSKRRLEFTGNQFNQFEEERFHSLMRIGNCAFILGHDWSDVMSWYMKAFEAYLRSEPLIKIADYYRLKADAEMRLKSREESFKYWRTSYMFLREACELNYPETAILFVDRGIYDYYRWHLLGIVGYNVNRFEEGKIGCLKAISQGINKELNEKNLKLYLDKEQEDREKGIVKKEAGSSPSIQTETKQQFLERIIQELKVSIPNTTIDKLQKRAVMMWKRRKEEKKN